jgi:hypothetical protein
MIHPTRILLMAAFSLIMSATAQTAPKKNPPPPPPPPIQIPSLPFTISAPGTYVLTGNMTAPITPYKVGALTLSNITIDNIVFNLPVATGVAGVWFNNTSSSIVSNCTFNGIANDVNDVTYGIVDHFSRGGNSYNNNTFVNMFYPIIIQSAAPIPLPSNTSHLVLNSCQFAPPPPPTP